MAHSEQPLQPLQRHRSSHAWVLVGQNLPHLPERAGARAGGGSEGEGGEGDADGGGRVDLELVNSPNEFGKRALAFCISCRNSRALAA